jgi:hypothetical protein
MIEIMLSLASNNQGLNEPAAGLDRLKATRRLRRRRKIATT